jgi:hypothetical protein
VVQKLPMGQAAPLVRMVARDQGALLEKIASGERRLDQELLFHEGWRAQFDSGVFLDTAVPSGLL